MVNNAFRCTPLAVLSILFGLVFIIFGFLYFYFFLWLQVLLVSFTPTYVFSYFWLKINSVLSVSSRVTSYSLQWILENKFYICSPCRACFFFSSLLPAFLRFGLTRAYFCSSSSVGDFIRCYRCCQQEITGSDYIVFSQLHTVGVILWFPSVPFLWIWSQKRWGWRALWPLVLRLYMLNIIQRFNFEGRKSEIFYIIA